MSRRTASPQSWPCSSLTALKLSTSHSIRHTGWWVTRAWTDSSTKRGASAWRLSSPVSGSRIASPRWCSSAACSASTIDTTAASSASVAITGTGSRIVAALSMPSVAARITSTVSTSPAITTCARKRAAVIAAGSTSHGNAGLLGPPLSTTPAPITSIVITIAHALTRSGLALVLMRRSTLTKLAADSASRMNVHQPSHGAAISSARPIAPVPTMRMVRARAFASTTRLRSSSVGHSQDSPCISPLSAGWAGCLRAGRSAQTHARLRRLSVVAQTIVSDALSALFAGSVLRPVDPPGQLSRPEVDQAAALDRLVLAIIESKPVDGPLLRIEDQHLVHLVGGEERELLPALVVG